MQLKSEGMQAVGYLEIRSKPGFEVEIANCPTFSTKQAYNRGDYVKVSSNSGR